MPLSVRCFQKFGEIIYYDVGSGLFQCLPGGVSVGDCASGGTGRFSHQYVNWHIAHHYGIRGIHTKFFECP